MNFNQHGGRRSITHTQHKTKLINDNSRVSLIGQDHGISFINQIFADHFKSVRIKELSQQELIELKKSVESGCIGGV